jgi:hypothetical protein
MYADVMSEWNYTKCTKPFDSIADAEALIVEKGFAGHLLKRDNGYAAVCPACPDGCYPDAVLVLSRDCEKKELSNAANQLPITSARDCC